jgi:hypothetical protein
MTIIKVKRKHAQEVGGRFVAVVGKDYSGKAMNIRADTLMELRQQLENSMNFHPADSWSAIEKRLDSVGIWELFPKFAEPSLEPLTYRGAVDS